MPLILGTNSIKDTGYNVDNSLRFNSGSTDSLSRTPSSASNRRTFTISMWFKRSSLTSDNGYSALFTASSGDSGIFLNNDGTLEWYEASGQLDTSRVFRDVSAWYHVVVAFDTTQGTASNRVKLYINGVQETAFDTESYPSENAEGLINNTGKHAIGVRATSTNMAYGGYMAEVVLIDGTALDPTSFGEFDSDSGIWKPKDVSGLTFGTNGFYLDFESSGSLGADVSGNGNNFTVNNLTATDQTTDTCTNNFATLSPLIATAYGSELSNGNLDCVQSDVRGRFHNVTTIGASSGKYYAEIKLTGGSNHVLGVATDASFTYASTLLTSGFNYLGQSGTLSYSYYVADGTVYVNGTNSSHGATLTTNDILGIYLDLDNHKLYFSKNGALQSSTGIDIPTGYDYFFGVGDLGTGDSGEVSCNFGNPVFSISSSNTDDNGYGNFEYSPNITGDGSAKSFYALNTKNLAEFG